MEIKTYMLLQDNIVTAFYRSDVNDAIPDSAIEISDELWQALLAKGQARLVNTRKRKNLTVDDFEVYQRELTEIEKAEQEIQELKTYLVNTDYVAIKIAEGVATAEEYTDVLEQRRLAREKIRELKEGE